MGIIRLSKRQRRWMRDDFRVPNELTFYHWEDLGRIEDVLDAKFKAHGVDVRYVENTFKGRVVSFNNSLRMPDEWEDAHVLYRCAIKAHELTHYRQRSYFGPNNFQAKYLFSQAFRVAAEVPAYIEGGRFYRAQGMPKGWLEDYIDRSVEAIRDCGTWSLDWKHTRKLVRREMNRELLR